MPESALTPKLFDVFEMHSRNVLEQLYCALPGIIHSYDKVKTTAQIEIRIKFFNQNLNKTIDYPILLSVPVLQLTGGTAGINMPIVVGDPCLVIFADRDIDAWFSTGSSQVPPTDRIHNISDGFALVGFRPLTMLVAPPDVDAASLYKDATEVSVKNNKARIKNGTTDLKTLLDAMNSAVAAGLNSISVTGPPGGPYIVSHSFSPPTPGDLLY